MECELTEPAAFPEPEHVGIRVEVLPDVYVEIDTARRIQALIVFLLVLLAILAATRLTGVSLRSLLATRPVLAPSHDIPRPRPSHLIAPRPQTSPFLDGFYRARKRAEEVLQYALTTAPDGLAASAIELSSDPATPFDPATFRLRITCAPSDPSIARGFVENLRVILPGAGVVSADAGSDALVVDSHPAAVAPLPAVTPARDAAFPFASAIPAPSRGKLVPLLAAPPRRLVAGTLRAAPALRPELETEEPDPAEEAYEE